VYSGLEIEVLYFEHLNQKRWKEQLGVTQPKPSLPVGEMTASRVAIGSTRQTKAESWSCSFVMARASQDLANPTHGQGRNKEYKTRWRA